MNRNKTRRYLDINTIACFLFLCLITTGCNHYPESKQLTPRKLIIQPFDDVPSTRVDYVFRSLSNHFPDIEIAKPIALPPAAYTKPRNRYRADSIIQFLDRRTKGGMITIGLTGKDISVTQGEKKDWGVMGLGFCPGKACVASAFRLSKANTDEQLFKVAIHEIGHTEGLPHCEVNTCFMRDAEGKNRTDMLHSFCEKCKTHLVKRGWHLL